jgi:hypothetical protein
MKKANSKKTPDKTVSREKSDKSAGSKEKDKNKDGKCILL